MFLFVYNDIVGQSNTMDEHTNILITAIYVPYQQYYFDGHISNIISTISFFDIYCTLIENKPYISTWFDFSASLIHPTSSIVFDSSGHCVENV